MNIKPNFKHLTGDFFGGITAGVVALPLALAFGVTSGLGPSAGLYGAIFIGFFASLFGGTRVQVSGPTAPMTAVSMVVIVEIIGNFDGDIHRALPIILTVFLLAGIIQVGLGMMGLGRYIKYIPYPVVSGFMTAIGVIILVTQLLPSVGYYPKEDLEYVDGFKSHAEEIILDNILKEEAGEGILVLEDFRETIMRAEHITSEQIYTEAKILAEKAASGVIGALSVLPRALRNINWLELILTISTIVIIYGFKYITTKVPSTLVALLLVSGVAIGFNLDYRPIEAIPTGLPIPNIEIFTGFTWNIISPFIFTAITLALLGSIDSLLTSVVADNMTKTRHNPNQELVGQGIGNGVAAIFGGIPGAGATIRTIVNIKAGGRTRLSGVIASLLLFTILLALSSIASKIPIAVLSGILITVGIGVMDYKGLRSILYMPRTEVLIMLVVLVLSSLWNLVYAVGIGLVIASLMFMKTIGDLTSSGSEVKSLQEDGEDMDKVDLLPEVFSKTFVKHIRGPLFFGSTSDFQQLAKQIPDKASIIIIRLERMPYMDQSGLYAMEDVLLELVRQKKSIFLVGILNQPKYLLERCKIIPNLVSEDHLFADFDSCLMWIKTRM